MAVVLLLLALAVASWSGLGLTLLLWGPVRGDSPDGAPRRLPGLGELCCLSFLLGTGNVAVTMELTGFLTSAVPAITVVECVLLGAIGVALRRSTVLALARRRPSPRDAGWTAATFAAIATLGSVAMWFSLHTSLEWDGLTVWFFKAQLAATHHGRIPAAYYRDPTLVWSAPNHPVYLPLVSSWIFGWMRHTSEYAIKALFPLYLVASAGLIAGAVRRTTGRRALAAVAPLLMLATPVLLHGPGSAASGYADVPIGAFYLAAVLMAVEFLHSGAPHARRVLAALGIVLPLVKLEGTHLFGITLLIVTVVLIVRARHAGWRSTWRATLRTLATTAAPFVAIVVIWRAMLGARHVNVTGDLLTMTPHNLLTHLDRTGPLLASLGREITDWDRWSLLWVWCVVALVLWTITRTGHRRIVLPLLLLVPIALDVGVFYFSSWSPVTPHIDSTLYRLLIHVVPVAVLLIVLSWPVTDRPAPDAPGMPAAGGSNVAEMNECASAE